MRVNSNIDQHQQEWEEKSAGKTIKSIIGGPLNQRLGRRGKRRYKNGPKDTLSLHVEARKMKAKADSYAKVQKNQKKRKVKDRVKSNDAELKKESKI